MILDNVFQRPRNVHKLKVLNELEDVVHVSLAVRLVLYFFVNSLVKDVEPISVFSDQVIDVRLELQTNHYSSTS